ncbi:putative D-alanyl-D-alanine carboxypeptidase (Peptidase S11)(DD-carboxypeptidase) [Bradyrhizobium sp. ORS 278]|uniref:D-alanyl-D-alanine carboxypeptidase n=1 Tax=Bradyrhizobium sp. (strain ORS 278) TaxID=114615 RepID=UPI0001508AA1|nr:D-alanyl-D-alanine carboxypeptidase [Bradyrhizobium sp. ORS 278]CAL78285.1 putative D-alanyl-D-alanine carboxypeptidase (Peptidase S11)(DD-carboxypeptidase) [Bradyrhizobium sp. ORS 278]
MLRKNLASSRLLRVGVSGLITLAVAAVVTVDSAEARRHHRHHARHSPHNDEGSYSPAFASIVVDGNSGATLTATNPDALRHPASLTKIMTLYLLFERLDSGKMKLDTEMPVSEHASEQSPTKLGLRPGQTIRVEDAIKGLVTRSANDAAVVIAEAIGGDEDEFAKMMTRKARSLGMSRTTYVNASGLPADEQITTARDQSILGRAIQDRFPRYYRYFSTVVFNYRGQSIRNHNHLLGNVEGIDGIKTGYTRASGFNIVTSLRRGNRHLVGVVLGGRSGGSRDAIMRNLLAENLEKGATKRTVAAVGERGNSDAGDDQSTVQLASAAPETPAPSRAAKFISTLSEATAALPPAAPKEAKVEPAPMTNGVIQNQPISLVPGSTEPMKPVKVRTVQVKAGAVKLATAAPQPVAAAPAPAPFAQRVEAIEPAPPIARAEVAARPDMPPQPPGHGTGNGILGVLPASSLPPASSQAMAYAAPPAQPAPPAPVQMASANPAPDAPARAAVARSGWIIQVGALDSEAEAQKRIDAARSSAQGLLSKADPFTETVSKGDKTLIRARFAGLDRDQAEAVCKKLKRADISCMTVHN